MKQAGSPILKTYLDADCTKQFEGHRIDFGETQLDGHQEQLQLYVRNEGLREWVITNARWNERPDVKIHYTPERLKPGEVMLLEVVWDTSKPIDDLNLNLRLDGKFYPFGDRE